MSFNKSFFDDGGWIDYNYFDLFYSTIYKTIMLMS